MVCHTSDFSSKNLIIRTETFGGPAWIVDFWKKALCSCNQILRTNAAKDTPLACNQLPSHGWVHKLHVDGNEE